MADDRHDTDVLRGVACLLVVLFHATVEARLYTPNGLGGVAHFNDLLHHVRMPLFTFLSGYVYAFRPLTGHDRFGYLRRKSRRLILPVLFVSMVTVIAREAMQPDATPGLILGNWLQELIRPSFQLWFVEALFVIFIFLTVGLYKHVFSFWLLPAAIIGAVAIEWSGLSRVREFSIVPAFQLLPYFLVGALFRMRGSANTQRFVGAILVTLITFGFWRALQFQQTASLSLYLLPLAVFFILRLADPTLAGIARIGRSSMGIFLYHGLVLAAFAPRLTGAATVILAILASAAIILPMLFEMMVARIMPVLLPVTFGQRAPVRRATIE